MNVKRKTQRLGQTDSQRALAPMLALVLALASACDGSAPATASPVPLLAPSISATPGSDEGLITEVAMRRRSVGLPAGDDLVRTLLSDPTAVDRGIRSGYGFPLTQLELVGLDARARSVDDVETVIREYSELHRESWAGMSTSRTTGNVVAYFTRDLTIHAAALAEKLHVDAPYEIRPATWTLTELEALKAELRRNEEWFATAGAQLTGTGIDIDDNRVIVDVSSDRPDIVRLVVEQFDAGGKAEVLVGRFGPGPWEGGRGDLIVVARDRSGKAVQNLDCVIEADEPAAWGGDTRVTDEAGTCRFTGIGATQVTIILRARVGASVLEFGRDRTGIRADSTVTSTIIVTRSERPS